MQVLNLSIDAQTIQGLEIHHSFHYYNEINSFTEYFAVLTSGNKNALPEYKKSNHEKLQVHKHITINLIAFDQKNIKQNDAKDIAKYMATDPKIYPYLFQKEINPPPPKV